MTDSDTPNQEVNDEQIIEDISQIPLLLPGEGAEMCQVCGASFIEGDPVVVYVFRPAGTQQYQIGHTICGTDEHRLIQTCTLGVQEAFIAGRIGTCSDVATQSTWPVVLGVDTVAVSAAATKSLRWNPDVIPANTDTDTTDRTADQNQSRVIAWAGEQITATHSHTNSATDDHVHTHDPAAPRDPSGGAQR